VVLDVVVLEGAVVVDDDEVDVDGREVLVGCVVVLVEDEVVDVVVGFVVVVDVDVVGGFVVEDEVEVVGGLVVVVDVVVPSLGTVARQDAAATRVPIWALTTSPKSRSRFASPPASRWQ
jgi:hypothetical protein